MEVNARTKEGFRNLRISYSKNIAVVRDSFDFLFSCFYISVTFQTFFFVRGIECVIGWRF